ncbi:prepilin-type N-terminal cleavage/methylation domain-containing protein [Patescibacteria group bacterium]
MSLPRLLPINQKRKTSFAPLFSVSNSGQSIVELLIAMAVFSIIIVPFLSSLRNLTLGQLRDRNRIQAAHYAREGLEIVYNLSLNSEDWESFMALANTGRAYYPSFTPSGVTLATGEEQLEGGKYKRQILLESGLRDGEGNPTRGIDEPGVVDPKLLFAQSIVKWDDRGNEEEILLVTYLIEVEPY